VIHAPLSDAETKLGASQEVKPRSWLTLQGSYCIVRSTFSSFLFSSALASLKEAALGFFGDPQEPTRNAHRKRDCIDDLAVATCRSGPENQRFGEASAAHWTALADPVNCCLLAVSPPPA